MTITETRPAEVSILRLYLLRALYLLMSIGLGVMIWPLIIDHPLDVPHMNGVVRSLLGGVGLLALLGLRYPLQMIPLLLFELVWKVIWVVAFGVPLWLAGQLDPASAQTMFDCLLGVVLVPLALPWRYVYDRYVRAPGERWRTAAPVPDSAGTVRGVGAS
jgi:hypothetical protein